MNRVIHLTFVTLLFFKSVKCEELLLSALKKDIEDNVMERVIKYFSKYDKKFQTIEAILDKNIEQLKEVCHGIEVLQNADNNFKRKIDSLEQMNSNTSVEVIKERVLKLEGITKALSLRSCHEYKERGMNISGMYYIDPDGRRGTGLPFPVHCDFESGITEIMHDAKEKVEISHCSGKMCYHLGIRYPTSIEQIKTLIDLSDSCTQEIQIHCKLTTLYINGRPTGAWLNRDGKEEFYFAGSHHGFHVCACGINRSCSNVGSVCNCDTKKLEYQIDSGLITNMSALPITGFRYGNFQIPSQSAAILIGNLKCSGIKNIPPRQIQSSCQNLKRHGFENSGNYVMNDGSVAFCNMEKNFWDSKFETKLGDLMFKDVM